MSCFQRRHIAAAVMVVVSLLPAPAALADTSTNAEVNQEGLFGMIEISSANLSALPQWQHVVKSFPELATAAAECDARIQACQSQQMTLWRAKIAELMRTDKRIQLQEINRFLNGWKHTADIKEGVTDSRWATPLEFIPNGGRSEDFAIMKYVSLKELGFSPLAMRIVVTNDVLRNKSHTILSVSLRGKRFILDSLSDTILNENLVRYYVPLYSVNEKRRWAHIPRDFLSVQLAQGVKVDE
ncbi:transglutaminase-like cysteine peptidase [Sneathiella sp.]|uniref:transglutaminase-like cysteine peptidase n=1 Tax=Sneathiella sp. TaxID=1964365 RepID=UPI0035623027